MKFLRALSLVVVCLCFAAQAYGDPIPGIFSTGVNNAGVVLPPGTADAHYGGFATITDPAWGAAPAGTSWITHFLNGANMPATPGGGFPQDTVFSLNFNLAGYDPLSAQLSFKFMADNNLEIRLNGGVIGGTPGGLLDFPSNTAHFTTLSSLLTVNPFGLLAGLNTLTFTVRNNELIEGLLVQIVSNDVQRPQNLPAPIPEPSSIALWAVLAGAGSFASRWYRPRLKK